LSATLIAILMLFVSGVAAACALVAAKLGAVDRLLGCWFSPPAHDLASLVDHLTDIAETAYHEGLLRVERHPVLQNEPILRRGVALALEGESPASIRDRLLEGGHAKSVRRLKAANQPLVRWAQAAAITLAVCVLVWFLVVGSGGGSLSPAAATLAWFAICTSMIGLALSNLVHEPLEPTDRRLAVVLQAETAALIAAGYDSAAIRSALLAMITPEAEPPTRLSRAA
jgi:chemotaxis protein MotA